MEYEGHKIRITNGYYDVYYPDHPNARKDGNVMLHVIIASKKLGRPLTESEVVHHKDFNKLNNSEDNLMVFASQSDHTTYHSWLTYGDTQDYILYCKDGVYHCYPLGLFLNESYLSLTNGKRMRVKPCPKCGNLIRYQSTMCAHCYSESCKRVERPSRRELKQKIRTTPFTTIGKEYGVTDSAIRKWCKYYKLPFRSSDIKSLSGEEWKHI